MWIYYRGKELSGYVQTKGVVHGGYLAEVNDDYKAFVDWSAVNYYKPISEAAATDGYKQYNKPYVEYWTRDDDPTIVSDTFRPTKKSDGENKDPDEYGYIWTKVKRDLSAEEDAAAVEFGKAVLIGHITDSYNKDVKDLDIHETAFESETWSTQVEQAKAYQADNSNIGTLLQAIATGREMSVADLATKILEKNEAWQTSMGTILGKLQKRRAEIKAVSTQADMIAITDKYMNVSHTSPMEEQDVLGEDYDAMAYFEEDL